MNQIKEQLKLDINQWNNFTDKMRLELIKLPIGSVVSKKIKGKNYLYHQYRVKNKQQFKYINENSNELINKLIRKAFLKKSLPILEHNIRELEKTVDKFIEYNPEKLCKELDSLSSTKYLTKTVLSNNLDLSKYMGNEIIVKDWLNENRNTRRNSIYPEGLKHITLSGKKVRSKSEVIIAEFLENRGIAFKYEEPIELDGIILRPDFVSMRPNDLKLIYWEHFGLTGDKNYVNQMTEKLKIFAVHGITLWDNLIITFDTPEGSIDIRNIKKAMDLYGL